MSAVVRTVTSQSTGNILSSNLNSDLKENTDICKDLIKEISNKVVIADGNSAVKETENSKNDEHTEKTHLKDDESSSNQNQLLIRNIGLTDVREKKSLQVKMLSLNIYSPGRTDVALPIPFPCTTSQNTLFTLKEGSKYRITLNFNVTQKVVKKLTNIYTVWKAGIRVRQTTKLVGTFSPRQEQYTFESDQGITPSGFFVRGSFMVRSKFVDDDGNCYLDTTYYFDIRKDWGA
ncbi:rho GDP-dissociation inhibitor 1-like [Amaranthus tricolor]|uniref:rho GDP-dissociation inhibitor 1-like n=1 Tax=Amaranthus tricolor TaxID=29722 RepID=UPI0025901D6C|nr:rho GDP-dissociation inhibitor 1-like [Amaranthus tricolor]